MSLARRYATMSRTHRNGQVEVFYSYARPDERFRTKLETHLSVLVRQRLIVGWHDRLISAGDEWRDRVSEHLESSKLILLLISSDFLASDYCYDREMTRALARHECGEALVIPLIIRPCDWRSAPFGKLAALPKDGRPVTQWSTQDAAFYDITTGIRDVLTARSSDDTAPDGYYEPGRRDVIPGSADPRQGGWTDREVVLLSPLWATDEPLAYEELENRLENHPVRYCRPQLNIMANLHYYFTLWCYSRYCAREFLRLSASDAPRADRWRKAGLRCWRLCESSGFARHPAL
jgi:TIR domain